MAAWFHQLIAWMASIPQPWGMLLNYTLVFVFLSFLFVLPLVTFTVLVERKVIGYMQHRFGPNRVGPQGILQTIADAIKLITKEDVVPKLADPVPFYWAPIISFLPALIGFAVIGFGGHWDEGAVQVGNELFRDFKIWAPSDLNVALLFVLATSSISGIGIFVSGWASNNKYSLFGAMRGTAQTISYEVPMILTLLAVVLATGSGSFKDIALRQGPRWMAQSKDFGYTVDFRHPGTFDESRYPEDLANAEANYATMLAGWTQSRSLTEEAATQQLVTYFETRPAIALTAALAFPTLPTGQPDSPLTDEDLAQLLSAQSAEEIAPAILAKVVGQSGTISTAEQLFEVIAATPPAITFYEGEKSAEELEAARAAGQFLIPSARKPQARVIHRPDFTRIVVGADTALLHPSAAPPDDVQSATVYYSQQLQQAVRQAGVLPAGYLGALEYFEVETLLTRVFSQGVVLGWDLIAGGIPFIVPMFLGFLIFFITGTAETNRAPFDIPEAESELVSGFHTEYTGMKFALFFLGEYAAMILVSSVATITFLGAWWVPAFLTPIAEQWPVLYFFSYFLKMYFLIYVMIWFRATFPRLRPDQLMDFAWKVLVPASLINLMVVAYFQFADWQWSRLLETNYQIWYRNVLAGLNWPSWRLLLALLLLPLLPDLFNNAWPKARKYLTPFLWIFSIGFVVETVFYNLLANSPALELIRTAYPILVYGMSAWLFGMSLVTLCDDRAPARVWFLRAVWLIVLIVPVSTFSGHLNSVQPAMAEALAWVQRFLWFGVSLSALIGMFIATGARRPDTRAAILANDAVAYKPVSFNTGDLKADVARMSDLRAFYDRERPESMQTPSEIPDWRTARFPDEVPRPAALNPAQQEWGPVVGKG